MGFFDNAGSGLFSGSLGLAGGVLSAITSKQSGDREYERQKEFAQNGIRWKVDDAKAAGIHPIFAIGSNTPTYSPQAAVGSDYGLSQMGQNISRAIEAKQTPEERAVADLQREGLELDNEFKRAQIEKVRSDTLWDEMDYVSRQYRLSEMMADTAQTQRPPAMPHTDTPANMDPTINMYGFHRDPSGKLTAVIPGNDEAQRFEDKFLIEYIPFLGAAIQNLKSKYFGSEVAGHWWHGDAKGYLPYPPKRRKSSNGQKTYYRNPYRE